MSLQPDPKYTEEAKKFGWNHASSEPDEVLGTMMHLFTRPSLVKDGVIVLCLYQPTKTQDGIIRCAFFLGKEAFADIISSTRFVSDPDFETILTIATDFVKFEIEPLAIKG